MAFFPSATPLTLGLPAPPSRDRACRIRLSFSGLTVTTQQYGTLPWYDMALFALTNPADREAVYAAKAAAGDRHCLMSFDPDEGGHVNRLGPYADILIPYSHMLHPDRMRADTREVITHGFTPLINLGCDNEGDGQHLTRALERLQALVICLQADEVDLTPYVVVMPGWDGTFYGWDPAEIETFGHTFRALLPNGYLAIEHDPGHVPIGGGAGDWSLHGPMSTYDIILSEFQFPPSPTLSPEAHAAYMQQVWQVALRLLGPAWVPPADADAYMTTAYAISKWYLREGTPRGPYYPVAFEWDGGTFAWVQGGTTSANNAQERAYLSALGYGDCTG